MFRLLRPLLFLLDAERAHRLTLAAVGMGMGKTAKPDDPMLSTTVAGLTFPNPVGIAAGFDKNAEVPDDMLRLGFGFAEVGTVTPEPQDGNPRPRIFRLREDEAVINRLGFNNEGLEAVRDRLAARHGLPGQVGVNVGANKDSVDRIRDYATGVRGMGRWASYITVNISSPNTPGLRALQDRAELTRLVSAVIAARGPLLLPLFVKVAPDLQPEDVADIADVITGSGIDGLIISNTTLARDGLTSRNADEAGGMSGKPLMERSTAILRDFRRATGGKLPLIGVGGISSGADAYAKIRAGASLVQLYTGLVYKGPELITDIKRDLVRLLRRDGFRRVSEAVGVDS
ncbi:quinone-dependent dihydroorotate dehydrogenase [Polymorphobacter arshaanensis]|uniref:Dihydroorotate dehydrogenase (quinone) n=1 Tax=Glacieibacterium arshaanense TaxID=2511025 RepID=A0A4Y9EJZ0_9SPHN|nr:quinone-dependent dihydroorotate dehydrogenase [Polymorphobacter arshaanensis]TFU01073.1 quinone-dependent dihydroorotate dehydrogenase [Polymorphobacter arshaanensis]